MRKHRTHWPTGFHKEDRSGRPVFYDRVGQSDLAALRADPDGIDQDEMVQIFCQNMEVGEQGYTFLDGATGSGSGSGSGATGRYDCGGSANTVAAFFVLFGVVIGNGGSWWQIDWFALHFRRLSVDKSVNGAGLSRALLCIPSLGLCFSLVCAPL